MKAIICLALSFSMSIGSPIFAQEYSLEDIARMLVQDMSPTRAMETGQWFTNATSNGTATQALGIIYVHIPGSAGSVSIHAGIYSYYDSGWVKTQDVQGLFGMGPKDATFLPGRIELSTSTLGPDDPRCCPSETTRWSVDLASGMSTKLN